MTQQEYEQKKRECWEDFWKFFQDKGNAPNLDIQAIMFNTFMLAFDRAYALGKQTEIISQEEIEKAAEKYSQRLGKNRDVTWSDAENGFIAGANFALGKQEIRPFTEEEIDEVIQEHINRLLDGHRFDDELRANLSFEIMYYFRDAINKILGKQENDAEETQPPKFKRGDRVKTKYNDEYIISAVEPITDKYMYSLVCDNKSWGGMHLESKLRKVENK